MISCIYVMLIGSLKALSEFHSTNIRAISVGAANLTWREVSWIFLKILISLLNHFTCGSTFVSYLNIAALHFYQYKNKPFSLCLKKW